MLVPGGALAITGVFAKTSGDSRGCAPITVTYVGEVTGPVGAVRYEWDFDNPDPWNAPGKAFQPEAFGERVQRFYPEPGTYIATLYAVDSTGSEGYHSITTIIPKAEPGDEPGPLSTNLPARLNLPFRLRVRTVKRYAEVSAEVPRTGESNGRGGVVDATQIQVLRAGDGEPTRDAQGLYVHSFDVGAAPVGSTLSFYIRTTNPTNPGNTPPKCEQLTTQTAAVAASKPCPASTYQPSVQTRRTRRGVQIYPAVEGVFAGRCPITFTVRLRATVDGKRRVVSAKRRVVPSTSYTGTTATPGVVYLLYPKGKRSPNPVVTVDYLATDGTKPVKLKRQSKTIT